MVTYEFGEIEDGDIRCARTVLRQRLIMSLRDADSPK
jgi:hypothetical protein